MPRKSQNAWHRIDQLFDESPTLQEAILNLEAECCAIVKTIATATGCDSDRLRQLGHLPPLERLAHIAGRIESIVGYSADQDQVLAGIRDLLALRAEVGRRSEADLMAMIHRAHRRYHPFDMRWVSNPDNMAVFKHVGGELLVEAWAMAGQLPGWIDKSIESVENELADDDEGY